MPLFSRKELRSFGEIRASNEKIPGTTPAIILESSARKFSTANIYDIFLSHSYLDASTILGLKTKFEAKGLSVYVDWITDPQLDRSKVTRETASIVRGRMRQSRSLFYAHSENANHSNWMPWELGYMDAYRNERVAIIPISEEPRSDHSFQTREYLSLYPYLAPGDDGTLYIWNASKNFNLTRIEEWLAGKNP